MSDYTQVTSFGPKDALVTGNPLKLVKGTEIDTELGAIATAIASKYDSSDIGPVFDVRYPQLAVSNTFTGSPQIISNVTPVLKFIETDAAANNQRWQISVSGETWRLQTLNDAESGSATPIAIDRTSTTVDSIAFTATAITLNGVSASDYARLSQTNTFAGGLLISNTQPSFVLNETDGAANNRRWDLLLSGEQLQWRVVDDAVTSATAYMTVNRTANTVDSVALAATTISLAGTTITLNGVDVSDYARLSGGVFTGNIGVSNAAASIELTETDAAANNRRWDWVLAGEQLRWRVLSDAGVAANFMTVDRTGTSVDSINLIAADVTANGFTLRHNGNDGSGSGLDADLLDGQQGSFYTNASNLTSGTIPAARVTSVDAAATISSELIGFRRVPRRTSGFANGEALAISAGVTLNTSDMAAGNTFTIYNDSASSITITQGAGVTLRLAGTTTTGSRTLLARGLMTIWCNSGTEAIASGPGVT